MYTISRTNAQHAQKKFCPCNGLSKKGKLCDKKFCAAYYLSVTRSSVLRSDFQTQKTSVMHTGLRGQEGP